MTPDPTVASVPLSPPPVGARDKVRLSVRKAGPLRWLSHHDLMRTFERMLRRSELPFRSSKGFHPHPRLVFALSLPLGVVGLAEVVELELDEVIEPDVVRQRLAAVCPPGLEITAARRIRPNESARVVGFTYGLTVPPARRAAVAERLAGARAEAEWWVDRTRPAPRRLDIRPFVRDLRYDAAAGRLELDLWLTAAGTARPEEVLGLVGLDGAVADGALLERIRLHLQDDAPLPSEGQP
ncbi:MAG: TIGR03936 family radical SAM-associated protein [Gemmataceae bacterium]